MMLTKFSPLNDRIDDDADLEEDDRDGVIESAKENPEEGTN